MGRYFSKGEVIRRCNVTDINSYANYNLCTLCRGSPYKPIKLPLMGEHVSPLIEIVGQEGSHYTILIVNNS